MHFRTGAKGDGLGCVMGNRSRHTALQTAFFFFLHISLSFNIGVQNNENGLFTNSVDLNEADQNEPRHLDPHCLPSVF